MKAKFKIGDKVKIIDGSKIKGYAGGWVSGMEQFIDDVATITSIFDYGDATGYTLTGHRSIKWDERGLAPVKPETIIIYRKDNEVVALDKVTGKKGIAKCSPKDQFDFMVGAKLAFERLTTPQEEMPVYFTGRVVCIENKSAMFTKGKIYEFKNGLTYDDFGVSIPTRTHIQNIDDLNARLRSQFIEIVE